MSKIGTITLELQERANEMGFATIDEAIQAGYTPDILTGTWATPEKDEHDHYVELARNIYDLMNKEFENIKAELTTPQDSDYYKLAFMYEIKEMVEQMDENRPHYTGRPSRATRATDIRLRQVATLRRDPEPVGATTGGTKAMSEVDQYVFGPIEVPTIIRKERGERLREALKNIQ